MAIRYDEIGIAVPILAVFFWIENNIYFVFLGQLLKFLYIGSFADIVFLSYRIAGFLYVPPERSKLHVGSVGLQDSQAVSNAMMFGGWINNVPRCFDDIFQKSAFDRDRRNRFVG